MWPEDDSDDEYDEAGRYKHRYHDLGLELVYKEQRIRESKNNAYDAVTSSDSGTPKPDLQRFLEEIADLDDRGKLRAYIERPAPTYIFDWRLFRALFTIRAFRKFHEGSLDLSGRFPERYAQLTERIIPLVTEFCALSPYTVIKDFDGWEFDPSYQPSMQRPVVVQLSDIADEHIDIWHQFKARWKLSLAEYTTFAREMGELTSGIQAHPQPVFQTRHLLDLPPELLLNIMEFVSPGLAIMLAATCRRLRTFALATAFSSHSFGMSVPDRIVDKQPSDILALMTRSRDDAIRRIEFFLSRPDMRGATRRLGFYNSWPWEVFGELGFLDSNSGDYSFADIDSDFYEPLRTIMHSTIRGDIPIASLSISHFMIDGHLAMNIARHPTLQDLTFRGCTTSIDLRALILSGTFQQLPPSNSRTLRVYVLDSEDIHVAWCALAICRNPRVFSITYPRYYNDIVAPHPEVEHMLISAFARVQRLHLTHVPHSLIGLADWLTTVHAAGHQLRLTHLKLESTFAMDGTVLLAVLAVVNLANSPLRVLALDGTDLPSLDLFDHLASMLPNLEGLTIIARGPRQTRRSSCVWPHCTYEYAAKLALFPRLRMFGANFEIDLFEFAPIGLPQFQIEEFGSDTLERWWEEKDRGYMDDTETSVVRPFAAMCPTLETFVLTGVIPYICSISRIFGRLVLTPDSPHLGLSGAFASAWNPVAGIGGDSWAPPSSPPPTSEY